MISFVTFQWPALTSRVVVRRNRWIYVDKEIVS